MPLPEEDGGNDNLEGLIRQLDSKEPSFQAALEEEKTAGQRILGKWKELSLAAFGGLMAIPGNPAATPVIVAAATYWLSHTVMRLRAKDKRSEKRILGEGAEAISSRFFGMKTGFSFLSAAIGLSYSMAMYAERQNFGTDTASYYMDLVKTFPDFTPQISYSLINGLGAYSLLSGAEKVFHLESVKVRAAKAKNAFYRLTGQKEKAAETLEDVVAVSHSKEKEVAALLALGDAYSKAGMGEEAINAYTRMLGAAKRKDDSCGVSDWLVGKVKAAPVQSSNESLDAKIQDAMHSFAEGNYEATNGMLKEAIAADPKDLQLLRLQALFFEATGNDEQAKIVMRIYEECMESDPSLEYRLVGESRNEVLVPKGRLGRIPAIYKKRNPNKSSLEDEVGIIDPFSEKLLGKLPRMIGWRLKDGQHSIALEQLGNITMHQKALAGAMAYSDYVSVIDLLVDVVAAANELESEGKIRIKNTTATEEFKQDTAKVGVKSAMRLKQPNPLQNHDNYVERLNDIFYIKTQESNHVKYSSEFNETFSAGALVIGVFLCADSSLNFAYTDFNPRNIMFDSLHGSLVGKVDWEQVRRAPITLELVNIMEFYGSNLSPVAKQELTNYFIRKMENRFGVRIDRKQFKFRYETAAVARHLELTGYMSRDAVSDPEYNRAQVYNHLMAKMHLHNLITMVPKTGNAARKPLEELFSALESTPILKDADLQRQLENEIRVQIQPSIPYVMHEITQKAYWQDFFKGSHPKELVKILESKPTTRVVDDLALPAAVLIGIPATLGGLAGYAALSYNLLSAVMPSLPLP